MAYKMFFWITLTIPFGLSASQINNSSLLKTGKIISVAAWLQSASVETKNKSVGTSIESTSKEDDSASSCIDKMIEMQEKTANLYKAQNRMLEKLARNQEVLYQQLALLQCEVAALLEENNGLKQRISKLESQKNS